VDDLRPVLDRAQAHGGDTLVERTALPAGMGYFAQLRDCEGNRVGLWSPV
jgi:predicted enzyme related to lactoylglutathione lyase